MGQNAPDVQKRRLFSGVMLLTLSNLFVKAAGLLFKIPMNRIAGDAGMGYYNAALSVYALFYMLTAAGLPTALSVLVAEAREEGNVLGAKQTVRRSGAVFLLLGAFSSVLMGAAAGPLASLIRAEDAEAAVRCAAPAVFFLSVSGVFRGTFQGCGNLAPTALSQSVEAAGKLVIGIAAALYSVRRGESAPVVAARAVTGLTAGAFLGMLTLLLERLIRGDRDLLRPDLEIRNAAVTPGETFRRLRQIALPVTASAAAASLSSFADTLTIQRALRGAGMTAEGAAALFGNYTSLAVPLCNLPPVFVYPAAAALTPAVAAILAGERTDARMRQVRQAVSDALRYASLLGLPAAAGLAAMAGPILGLLFREESARVAAPLLILLAPTSYLLCILAVTNAALQGMGKAGLPFCSVACGALVKFTAGPLLLGRLGIAGAPLSTFFSMAAAAALNLVFLIRAAGGLPAGRGIVRILGSALLCGVCARWSCGLFARRVGWDGAVIPAIALAAALYLAALPVTGAVSPEEIRRLLKGRKERKRNDRKGTEEKAAHGRAA